MGAVSLVGWVGQVKLPHLVLPLTVEPTKPRTSCRDARFLNLWMQDKPFILDKLTDLARYVSKDTYQSDIKFGYDHLLLSIGSHKFFGLNRLVGIPHIVPKFHHMCTIPLQALCHLIIFALCMGIPCLLYIDH